MRKEDKALVIGSWVVIVAAVVVGTLMWTVLAPEKVFVNSVHTAVLAPVLGYLIWNLMKFNKKEDNG
jgi:hypothetical protein